MNYTVQQAVPSVGGARHTHTVRLGLHTEHPRRLGLHTEHPRPAAALALSKARKKRFIDVWKKNLWASSESRSGRGSERRFANDDIAFLLSTIQSNFVGKHQNLTIVDAPCASALAFQTALPSHAPSNHSEKPWGWGWQVVT